MYLIEVKEREGDVAARISTLQLESELATEITHAQKIQCNMMKP